MRLFLIFCFSALIFCGSKEGIARNIYQTHSCSESIKIDGRLNEKIWSELPIANNFIQTIPSPDKPSSFNTEVRITYTNTSIIIGARMMQNESMHSRQICTRDGCFNVNADIFSVFFDTYDDHQNGFVFRVSSAGVQQDERLSMGEESGDVSWDAVWESSVSVEADAWTVEMEIPFSALRFSIAEEMQWGLNFLRQVRMLNENSYWNKIDVQKQGFLAQSGLLKGLTSIHPPVRLFLFPYVSTGLFNQYESGKETKRWLRSGGLDIKYGLSESFTLDMTLVPDFSQVISDNLVRNLSPFEQQLNENRPFFTEGTELFNKAGIFYSRRIGGRPSGYYGIRGEFGDTSQYEIQRNPNITTLYNAVKISGRTRNNIGIGVFNAIGAPMYAEVKNKSNGTSERIKTESFANYNVIVLDKALHGQSNIHFANTNVIRADNGQDANVSAFMFTKFFNNEKYRVDVQEQVSMQHIDTKIKTGTQSSFGLSKVSGKLTYSINSSFMSPSFDKRDMGIQFDFNHSLQSFSLNYNENKPISKHLQLYRMGAYYNVAHNTQPFSLRYYETGAYYFLLFKNFWDITFSAESKPKAPIDYYQLSDYGMKLKTYPYLYLSVNGSSDSRKKLFWAFYGGYGSANEPHTSYRSISQQLRYRFSTKVEVSTGFNSSKDENNIGYAFSNSNPNLPIIGLRDITEFTSEVNIKYNASPNINFTARFRHYNSFVLYRSFHQTEEDGEWRNLPVDYTTAYNENFNLQNIDVFFNWIFRPGSRMVVSYKQWLNDAYILNDRLENTYLQNVRQVIHSPKAYEMAVRFIYFIDYSKVKMRSVR
jgi:hypothetical protein